jgi:hypothetical protein
VKGEEPKRTPAEETRDMLAAGARARSVKMLEQPVVVWSVVDAWGEVVDAKTTRAAAFKRVEFLDDWATHNESQGRGAHALAHSRRVLAPFSVVRCSGVVLLPVEGDS